MTTNIWRIVAVTAAIGFSAGTAVAGGSADDDLRRAAKLHKNGETVQALAIWRGWADQGNVDAAYNLAVVHHHGDGVARDAGEAMKWYRHAAERGDRVSQYQIGLMYQLGDGVAANAAEAHRWFTAHRQHHVHHEHDAQMQQWRSRAAAMIWQRDMHASLARSREEGARIVAELQRRAATTVAGADGMRLAAATGGH